MGAPSTEGRDGERNGGRVCQFERRYLWGLLCKDLVGTWQGAAHLCLASVGQLGHGPTGKVGSMFVFRFFLNLVTFKLNQRIFQY
jgi:hypothetical protein